ncbi:hypothetical protein DFJ43DRAFT_509528, partial [Lentinula guzmanii]
PLPLLLLIHLQILQYPHVNNEDFDIHIFDAHRRGLRARTTMMENLGYWLVVKIEGNKKVKKIEKYLDGLRQSSIKENSAAAVWWKEDQARKSYLEECSEGKFLRLLLALSTLVFFTLQSVSNVELNPKLHYLTRLAFVQASQRQLVKVPLRPGAEADGFKGSYPRFNRLEYTIKIPFNVYPTLVCA